MHESARYKYIYVNGRKVLEHVYVWEQAHGPKPEGCDIHHINGDGKDNRLENLVCLTKSEHKTLHAEMKREGWSVVDESDPAIHAERARTNANTKAHRLAHLEEERAKDREEYQQNRERKQQQKRDSYQRNREHIRESQAAYERAHKAERAARNAAYYAAHTQERIEYSRAYHAAHREEHAAKKREYNATHQEQLHEYRQDRKAVHTAAERLRRATVRGEPEETLAQLRASLEEAKRNFKERRLEKGKEVK